MALMKGFVVVAAIAVVLGLPAQAESTGNEVSNMCVDLKYSLVNRFGEKVDEETAMEHATKWVAKHYSASSAEAKLFATLKDIKENPECSSDSWSQLYLLNKCAEHLNLPFIDEAIKGYTNKCLTPDYTNKVVKSKASYLFSAVHVDFVNAEFIKKYRSDNPDDRPLHVTLHGYDNRLRYAAERLPRRDNEELNCCTAKKSLGAVLAAIESDYNKKGKDPKTEFKGNRSAVAKYLEKKLIKPCRRVAEHYKDLGIEIRVISRNYEGGDEALIGALDQEAKDIIFGYRYCTSVGRQEGLLVTYVVKSYE